MLKNKSKPQSKQELWLKILPITIAAIGLGFSIYKGCSTPKPINESERKTWNDLKAAYNEVYVLSGKIAATHNDSLQKLSHEYDNLLYGTLRTADNRVKSQMLTVKKNLIDAINNDTDYFQPDILKISCLNLIDSIKYSIEEGDRKFGN